MLVNITLIIFHLPKKKKRITGILLHRAPPPQQRSLDLKVSFDLMNVHYIYIYIYTHMKFNSTVLVWVATYLKGKISAENKKNTFQAFFRLEIVGKIRIFAGGRKPKAKVNTKQRARIVI